VILPVEVTHTPAWGWVLKPFTLNALAVFLWHFAFELHLAIRRAQGNRFKYNSKFPADAPSDGSGSTARTWTMSCAASCPGCRRGRRSR
jgi:hypothetical protein